MMTMTTSSSMSVKPSSRASRLCKRTNIECSPFRSDFAHTTRGAQILIPGSLQSEPHPFRGCESDIRDTFGSSSTGVVVDVILRKAQGLRARPKPIALFHVALRFAAADQPDGAR